MFLVTRALLVDSPFRNIKRLQGLGKFKTKRYGRDVLVCGNEEKLLTEFFTGPRNFGPAFQSDLSRRIAASASFLSPSSIACLADGVQDRNKEEFIRRLVGRVGEFHGVELLRILDVIVVETAGSEKFISAAVDRFPSIVGHLTDEEAKRLLKVISKLRIDVKGPAGRLGVLKLEQKLKSGNEIKV